MARKKPEPRYTGVELAELCGVGRSAITEAKKVGRISIGEDGKYGPEAVEAFHASRSTTPGPGRMGLSGGGKSVDDEDGDPDPKVMLRWRIISEREKALKLRLERRAAQGKLVPIDVVESERAETGALIRARLEGIAPKLCDKLAASSSPSECREMVAAEVRLALEELANRAEEVDDE